MKNVWCPQLDYSNVTDASLSGMIGAASRWVDSITNADTGWEFEAIVNEEVSSVTTCHTNADGDLVIPMIKRPVDINNVSDITIKKGAYQTHLTLTSNGVSVLHSPSPGWSILYPNTWLVQTGTLLSNQRLYNLRSFGYSVLMTYSGGYSTIPDDIKYATALATQNSLAKQYNPAGAMQVTQGSMSMTFGKGKIGDESPLLSEAKQYLKNYIRVV
jgi:hypothetical protein